MKRDPIRLRYSVEACAAERQPDVLAVPEHVQQLQTQVACFAAAGEGDGPMLADDAQKAAAELEKSFNAGACQGVKATVKTEQMSPKSVPAGAGRPTFINYYIQIDDGTRTATLTLGQAGRLLMEVQPDWDPDRLFEKIRALDAPVADTN